MKALEEDQKRRATRSLRDGIDRILTDLLSLYRDVVLVQLGAPESVELVNEAIGARVREVAAGNDSSTTLAAMDAIAAARRRIAANVAPALSLEAMLITLAEAGRTVARKVSL
jgi:DNA polymerase-3 subunit delta'